MNQKKIIFSAVVVLILGITSVFFIRKTSTLGSSSHLSSAPVLNSPSNGFQTENGSPVSPQSASSAAQFKSSPQSSPFKSSERSTLPTVTGAAATSEMGGTPAMATVKVGKNNFNLTPNEAGVFPRVLVPENGKVQISVSYPEGTPEDLLVIQAEDGGILDNQAVIKQGKLDSQRNLSFEFQTNEERGIYRVSLRKGTDQKWLDFWVGKELQLKSKS